MPIKLVESVNSLDPSDFFNKYLPQATLSPTFTSDTTVSAAQNQNLHIVLTGTGRALTAENKDLLDQCLRLIESTSGADYRHAGLQWSVSKKRREMQLPDMRYMILTEGNDRGFSPGSKVAGFVSFMITYEDGREVIYCYEIHLTEAWQGQGIGKKLMATVEAVGQRVGVEKSMLTVFRANTRAVSIYERLGYSEDEFSPGPRRLRNGTVKEPSYVILSKNLRTTGS